jgi:hypothetical protein
MMARGPRLEEAPRRSFTLRNRASTAPQVGPTTVDFRSIRPKSIPERVALAPVDIIGAL